VSASDGADQEVREGAVARDARATGAIWMESARPRGWPRGLESRVRWNAYECRRNSMGMTIQTATGRSFWSAGLKTAVAAALAAASSSIGTL